MMHNFHLFIVSFTLFYEISAPPNLAPFERNIISQNLAFSSAETSQDNSKATPHAFIESRGLTCSKGFCSSPGDNDEVAHPATTEITHDEGEQHTSPIHDQEPSEPSRALPHQVTSNNMHDEGEQQTSPTHDQGPGQPSGLSRPWPNAWDDHGKKTHQMNVHRKCCLSDLF